MVFFPTQVKGKAWKLARPYFGPYKMLSLTPTNAEVQLTHDSKSGSIFVTLERIHHCYYEMSDKVWMGHGVKAKRSPKSTKSMASLPDETPPNIRSMSHRPSKNSGM